MKDYEFKTEIKIRFHNDRDYGCGCYCGHFSCDCSTYLFKLCEKFICIRSADGYVQH